MEEGKIENKQNEPDSKYLVLWLCVIICAGIIFVGWLFSVKYNFQQINKETAEKVNKTSEQATKEVLDMFDGAGAILKQGDETIQQLKDEQQLKNEQVKPADVVVPEPAGQLPTTK